MIIVPSILIIVFVLLVVGGKIHLRGMFLFYTEESMMYDELAALQPERDRLHTERLASIRTTHEVFMAEVESWYDTSACMALVVHDGAYEPVFALRLAVSHQIDMQMAGYYAARDMHEMEE